MTIRKSLLILFLTLAVVLVYGRTAHAAVIHGTIKYEGAIPKFKEIQMDADPICLSHHREKVFPQTLVLGDDKTMGNVFVRIKDGIFDNKFSPPKESVILTQEGCMYDPHVIGVMAGQPLKILNPDGTLHNVHVLSKVNPEFNLAMPKFRKETTKVFGEPEFIFPVKCDVHPWMSAWIGVLDHPFFDITQQDGKFNLYNVPVGQFQVEAWHEKLGTQTKTVNVTGNTDYTVDFNFSKP